MIGWWPPDSPHLALFQPILGFYRRQRLKA